MTVPNPLRNEKSTVETLEGVAISDEADVIYFGVNRSPLAFNYFDSLAVKADGFLRFALFLGNPASVK